MSDGLRQWEWDPELSSIDTALLLAGILDAKEFFNRADDTEYQIRTLADQIYQRVDWPFLQRSTNQAMMHGWKPDGGAGTFLPYDWIGYSEAMIIYILAMGSPTHPIANFSTAWNTWTSGYVYGTQYGQTYVSFAPLFGHQYSHCWIDFRNMQDAYMKARGITYFENSRRATYAQRAYAMTNPMGRNGYSATLWGLTASDDPCVGYQAHGAPPSKNDNGTITPTAPISSIPFAPEICVPVAQNLYDNYKTQMWGPYGFKDAMNLTYGAGTCPNALAPWYDADVLGIDQGPIVIMIENYLTQKVWNRFTIIPAIQLGLQRAGFNGLVGVPWSDETVQALDLRPASPNPFHDATTLSYQLPRRARVTVAVFDVAGREVARLVDSLQEAGPHRVTFRGKGLSSGVYRARLEAEGRVVERNIVHLR